MQKQNEQNELFEWDEIVVNTNWLSFAFPLTIIYSRKYYKTITPVVNY